MNWKLSTANDEFIQQESDRLGISKNGALNVLLAELRAARRLNKVSTEYRGYAPATEVWIASGPNYEPGFPVGGGATEAEAIADLKEKEKESA